MTSLLRCFPPAEPHSWPWRTEPPLPTTSLASTFACILLRVRLLCRAVQLFTVSQFPPLVHISACPAAGQFESSLSRHTPSKVQAGTSSVRLKFFPRRLTIPPSPA